jgi:hypothetical protein
MQKPGGTKRQKERLRQEKAREKEASKAARRKEKVSRPDVAPGEDPDLAGIIPGPQPQAPEPE